MAICSANTPADDTELSFTLGRPQPVYPIVSVDPPGLDGDSSITVPNSILVEDLGQGGTKAVGRRPITISRMFARGEFPQFVQAVVDGNPVLTQCDVKTRWPDGSVRHVLLSFWMDLRNRQSSQVDFIQSLSSAEGSPLNREQMLGFHDGKWDIAVQASVFGGHAESTQKASARAILEAWDGSESYRGVRYWLKGPIVTQVIAEDRSTTTAFDFGWQSTVQIGALGSAITNNANSLALRDLSTIVNATYPVQVIIDQEAIALCGIEGNTVVVCPSGRGILNTARQAHGAGAKVLFGKGWQIAEESRYKSVHPIFVLTFYPGWSGVKEEVVLENAWLDRMQDQYYAAQVRLGSTQDTSSVLWESPLVRHYYGARWRRQGWYGETPGKTRVDHNFPYLIHSRAVPNYDLNLKINQGIIASTISQFERSDRGDPTGNALWLTAFPNTGGRPDIGLLPRWYVLLLYSWDSRLWDVSMDTASTSAHMPMHYRESAQSLRQFDPYSQAPAAARVLSIDAHPTFFIFSAPPFVRAESVADDRAAEVGALLPTGWQIDDAHQPSIVFLPYLLTGDWFYLEELHFWSAYNLGMGNPGRCDYCRFGSLGYFNGQYRGQAWRLRTLADTVVMTPDEDPEKKYFLAKLQNNIALREGQHEVTNGAFHAESPECKAPCSSSRWRLGKDVLRLGDSNPLRLLEYGNSPSVDTTIMDNTKVHDAASPWMWNFMHIVLGRIEEQGFGEVSAVRREMAFNLIQQLQNPDYNPYLSEAYRIPTLDMAGKYFKSWEQAKDAYLEKTKSKSSFDAATCGYCYAQIARGAAAWLVGIEDSSGATGKAAFEWIHSQLKGTSLLTSEPTWAFMPRGSFTEVAAQNKRVPKWHRVIAIRKTAILPGNFLAQGK